MKANICINGKMTEIVFSKMMIVVGGEVIFKKKKMLTPNYVGEEIIFRTEIGDIEHLKITAGEGTR